MNEPLEPEVLDAVSRENLHPERSFRISTFRSPGYRRATYRIELRDGRTIKARLLENETTARSLSMVRRSLPDAFAPVIARHGRVLLEEWVHGEALDVEKLNPARLAEAGALLGDLHARARHDGQELHQVCDTAAHRDSAVQSLQRVAAAGALEHGMAEDLSRTIRRLDPGRARFGLAHLDFCGENMVIDTDGRLRVVDNERVGVDALSFDLARAWYRWALPAAAWASFQSAYAARLPWNDPLEAMSFWRLRAVAGAAAVRLRHCPDRAETAVQSLRRLAVELAQ
jgi:thiamine kinase-like enzyme